MEFLGEGYSCWQGIFLLKSPRKNVIHLGGMNDKFDLIDRYPAGMSSVSFIISFHISAGLNISPAIRSFY
jgi:hypothetical protein